MHPHGWCPVGVKNSWWALQAKGKQETLEESIQCGSSFLTWRQHKGAQFAPQEVGQEKGQFEIEAISNQHKADTKGSHPPLITIPAASEIL